MAQCDKCQNKAWCYDGNHELTLHSCAENNWCCFSPVTNYDRLISKSPEELAEWLAEVLFHCSNTICDQRCPMYECCCDQPSDNI